jgi:hypothetical protein
MKGSSRNIRIVILQYLGFSKGFLIHHMGICLGINT